MPRLFLLLSLLMLLTACQDDTATPDAEPPEELIPFRIDGALDFLRSVHERNVRVLLVTNAHPTTLALKHAVTGLGDYFDGLYSSHTFGFAKESQEFWAALQDEVGFDRDTTLFVDDSQPVLRSADEYGIGMLVTVSRPDSTAPLRRDLEFSDVEKVADLLS